MINYGYRYNCTFDVDYNSEDLEQVNSGPRDSRLIKVGDCSPLCGENVELFLTTDDAPLSYSHEILNNENQVNSNNQSDIFNISSSSTIYPTLIRADKDKRELRESSQPKTFHPISSSSSLSSSSHGFESASICINMHQCNMILKSPWYEIFYYLLDGDAPRTGYLFFERYIELGECPSKMKR